MSVGQEVSGDDLVFGVAQNSLHGAFSHLLDLGADLVVAGVLKKVTIQNPRNVLIYLGQFQLETFKRNNNQNASKRYKPHLGQANSQVNNRHIGGWDAESHSGELAVQLGDDFADGLGGSGGGRNDVLGGATAIAPGLARWTIDGLLS